MAQRNSDDCKRDGCGFASHSGDRIIFIFLALVIGQSAVELTRLVSGGTLKRLNIRSPPTLL